MFKTKEKKHGLFINCQWNWICFPMFSFFLWKFKIVITLLLEVILFYITTQTLGLPSSGFHIVSCAFFIAEGGERDKRTKFEFSHEQQCSKNPQLQASVSIRKWDFCVGCICTVSPWKSINNHVLIFMACVWRFFVCVCVCMRVDSPLRKDQRKLWDMLQSVIAHFSDIEWHGKHLPAVCTPVCTGSDNHVLPKSYRKMDFSRWYVYIHHAVCVLTPK